jgi:hypothetical protein
MVGCQVRAEGGGRWPAFTGPATQPYSATEVDGWQRLSRVSQNRAAVHTLAAAASATAQVQQASPRQATPLANMPPTSSAGTSFRVQEHCRSWHCCTGHYYREPKRFGDRSAVW